MATKNTAVPVRASPPAPIDPRGLLPQLPADEIAELCGVSRATAARWQRGKARAPVAAAKLIALRLQGLLSEREEHRESPRVRAVKLRARMLVYHEIYNTAWHVRMAQHGAPEYRRQKVQDFMIALRRALEHCQDEEALIFAVADSLTAFPQGLPWDM